MHHHALSRFLSVARLATLLTVGGGAASSRAQCYMAGQEAAPPAWTLDFRDGDAVVQRDPAWIVSDDGRSIRSDGTPGTKTLKVTGLPDLSSGRFRLSFEAHEFARTDTAGHFGFALNDADGHRFFFFAQASIPFVHVYSADGVARENTSGGSAPFGRYNESPDPLWTSVALDMNPYGWTLRIDGSVALSGSRSFAGVTPSLTFHTLNVTVGMRDVCLEFLPEPDSVDSPAEPTFSVQGTVQGTFDLAESPVAEDCGTILWWQRPGSPGTIYLQDAEGTNIGEFSLYAEQGVRAQFRTRSGSPLLFLRKVTDATSRTDEFFHCAFAWGPEHRPRFFVNGLPYHAGGISGEKVDARLDDIDFASVRRVAVSANAMAHDLRLWRRTLSNAEIGGHRDGRVARPRRHGDAFVRRRPRRNVPPSKSRRRIHEHLRRGENRASGATPHRFRRIAAELGDRGGRRLHTDA